MQPVTRNILWVALITYTLGITGFAVGSYISNERHLVYALDDAYIHMAMARNIAEHATFGVTPYEFSASSSSPFWTFLLSGLFVLFGTWEWLPLVLNYLFGLAAIFIAWRLGVEAGLTSWRLSLLLASIVLLLPMLPIAFTGMEHLLHLAVVLLLLFYLWQILGQNGPMKSGLLWSFGLSIFLAVGIRFESLFVVAASSIGLAAQRRWTAALVALISALVPVVAIGAFAVANGQDSLLPNSVLIKGNFPRFSDAEGIVRALGFDGLLQLSANPHMFVLLMCLLALFIRRQAKDLRPDRNSMLLAVVILTIAMHMQFASTGWFYRYESYLVGMSLMVISIQPFGQENESWMPHLRKMPVMSLAFLAIVVVWLSSSLTVRTFSAHLSTVQATTNIFHQQYQMGRFLRRYYDGESVAANDIGAINFLAAIRCLDLWGAGSQDVVRLKRSGSYSAIAISELARARDVRIAIVYTTWFLDSGLPAEWTEVGSWTIQNNVVCSYETVTFMAVDNEEAARLRENFRAFQPDLPDGVVWREFGKPGPN